MRRMFWTLGAVACATALVSACGDGGRTGPAAAAPVAQALDTAQVLAQAREPSETATPYAVNQGLLVLTDTSETSEPLAVNAM